MLGIAGGDASALQGWINKGAGSMNDTANWSARVLPLTTQSSANSAWCFWYAHTNPTTMTLSEDLVTDRMVIDADKSGADATFALGAGRTLTFKGTTGIGIRVLRAGDVRLRLTSGTIRVDSAAAANNILHFPSADANTATGVPGTNNVFTVEGPSSVLDAPVFSLAYGSGNMLVVTNGGCFTGSISVDGGSCSRNAFVFSGTGSKFVNTDSSGVVPVFNYMNADDCRLTISDGAAVENFKVLTVGGHGTLVTVSGPGTAVATSGSRSTIGNTRGGSTRLEVSDGASFTFGGSDGRFWIGTSESSPSNSILISGAGTRFAAESASNHVIGNGAGSDGNSFVVRSHAAAEVNGNLRLGAGAGGHNAIRVEGGASAVFGNLYVGHGENGANEGNLMEVSGAGSAVKVSGTVELGLFAASATNEVRIADGAVLDLASGMVVGHNSSGNVLGVFDGSVVSNTASADLRVGLGAGGNRLSVDGGCVRWRGCVYTGVNNQQTSAGTNTIAVSAGGLLECDSTFFLFGHGNTLAITNGTLSANEVQMPYFNASDGAARIVLSGTNPVIRSATKLQIRRNSTVVFAPTGDGYVEPALQADGKMDLINSCTVEFDLGGLTSGTESEIVLAEANPLEVQENVMAAIKSAVPDGYRVFVRDNRLILRGGRGLSVLVR